VPKYPKINYFQSESQRKKFSKLGFIYSSKQNFVVFTCLVILSGIVGIVLLQRSSDSEAAVVPITTTASADTYVTKPLPSRTLNTEKDMWVRGGNTHTSLIYIQFKVKGIGSQQISNATLRLYHLDNSSPSGGQAYRINWDWAYNPTWEKHPGIPSGTPKLGELGSVTNPNTYYDMNLSTSGWKDGLVTIVLKSDVDDGLNYSTGQGGKPAQLILTPSGTTTTAPPPPPQSVPPPAPSSPPAAPVSGIGTYERPCPASGVYEKIPASEPKSSNSISSGVISQARNVNSGRGPTITGSGISPVRWKGTTSDPIWTQKAGSTSYQMYAPLGIFGAGTPDDTIEIYNTTAPGGSSGRIVRQWGGDSVRLGINSSTRTITSSTIGSANINGNCVPNGTGTAWGLMSVMGVVLRADWDEGVIDHAIGVALGNNLLSPSKFIAPATRSEGKAYGTLVPMGTRVCHTWTNTEIDAAQSRAGLSGNTLRLSDMLWKALGCNEYGFIIRDGTASGGFNIYMDNPYHWQGSGLSEETGFRPAIRIPELFNSNRWQTPSRSDY